MANHRRSIKARIEGSMHIARFRHPVLGRVVRFNLGSDAEFRKNLEQLNLVFLNEASWCNLPASVPDCIRRQWDPRDRVTVGGETVRKGATILPADKKLVARLTIERDALKCRVDELQAKLEERDREVEHWKGKKLAPGPVLTVQETFNKFFESYGLDLDPDHVKQLKLTLQKAVDALTPQLPVSKLTEDAINTWLKGLRRIAAGGVALPLGGTRRNFVRLYLLKMLTEGGAVLDRSKIETAKEKSLRRQRATIKWLDRTQAEKITEWLPSPWKEMFQLQCAIGLRPSELITLQRSNFSNDLSELTLETLGNLTLKTGSRTIPIPSSIRPMIELRLKGRDLLFADPRTNKAWANPANHAKRFVSALKKAATASGIVTKMSANIGRKTCASLLLQQNISAEKIAELLGNSAETILSNYGNADIKNLDLNKNVVGVEAKVG